MSQLNDDRKKRLESQCASLFLSCIDFDLTTNEDAIQAFDLLYSIYCEKFKGVDL